MPSFVQDVRYAARTLLKAPAASFVAILALALGIGVNVSAFISVNGIILHPLPFANLERIQTIWQSNPKIHLDREQLTPADFLDLEKQSHSFESLAACRAIAGTLRNGAGSEMVRIAEVSPAFFKVLSGAAALGHVAPLATNAVVISEAFWKTRLAGSRAVIGQRLPLAGGGATIIGVMPDDFDYPLGTEIWSPLVFTPVETQQRTVHNLHVLGLLRSDTSLAQAGFEAKSIGGRLADEFPATNAEEAFNVVPLRDLTEGTTNRFVGVILGSAGFVLLLACANIGNLQLARAANRQKEIAVRAALGASRFQIARQLLAETLLLSVAAGFLGVMLADWNNYYTKQNIPAVAMRIVPGLRTMDVDPSVLVFAFLVSVCAGLLCSLPAIFQLSRRAAYDNLEESLRERSVLSSQHSSGIFRGSLVASELALALLLLIGAGLMVGTFHRFLDLNQGFDAKNLLTAHVSLPQPAYAEAAKQSEYYERALRTLQQIPGISSVGLSSRQGAPAYFAIEGRPEHRSGEPLPSVVPISGRYLDSMRIPLLEGRSISADDTVSAPHTVVLSKTIARFYWPNASPVGQRLKFEQGGEWLTVVGVTADVIDDWFGGKPANLAYVSYAQFLPRSVEFVVRTQGAPLALAPVVRARLQSVDPAVPLLDLNTMEQALMEQRSGVQAAARTMAMYAVIALLLAITGIYAVVSYLVSMRTRDIGVHMALGATRAHVLKMMTQQTGRWILLGVAGGLVLSAWLTRLMAHVLLDVVQLDAPLWFVLTSALLGAAFLAAFLPALRATKIDPLTALRHD